MSKLEKLASVGLTDSPEDIKKFYDMFPTPDSYDAYMSVEQKYAMGGITNGIAFPQQPDASSRRVPYYDKGGFFAPNVMPWNGPVGFYQPGGENQDLINQFNKGDISREDINAQINPNFNIPFNRQTVFEGPDPQPGFTKTNDMNFFINRGIPDYNNEDMSDLDRSRKRPPTGGGGGNSANMDFRRWKANINRKWRGFKQNLRDKVRTCIGDACPKWEDGGFIDGIAFPQQPTEHINFSAFPWQPKYNMGGLPGGPNEGMPCMECGGYMEDGGPTQYGGMVDDQMDYFKEGGNWIQKATASIKKRGTEGVCTGSKFGGPSCPPGSKRYNLAKTFRKMAKKEYGGMAGAGMDDTDSYVQQYNNDFLERVVPQQEQDMGMEQQMPMAYNGMSIPQAYNMSPFGYNPYGTYGMSYEQEQNSQPINQQNVMNNYGYQRANKNLQRQNMGFLGAAFTAAQPWTDESRFYMDTKFTPWNDPNKKNTNTTNPGGGMTNNAKHGGNHPLLKAVDGITNPSSNAKPPSWDDANPNSYLDYYFSQKQAASNQDNSVPKWDANDPSKYLDYYFNKRKSANNQTKYDYGDWGSWDNVDYNNGSYNYNRPYAGGWGGMTQPMAKYLSKTFGSDSDYVLAPGDISTEYGRGFLPWMTGKRPKKKTYTFNVYKKNPQQQKIEEQKKSNKIGTRGGSGMGQMYFDDLANENQFSSGGYLPMAAGGFQNTTPNDITNMYNSIEKMRLNREIPEDENLGQVRLEEELKRDITGQEKAAGIMAGIGLFNYGTNMAEIQKNIDAMPKTADEIYDPVQAGKTGYQGNFLETGMGYGQEFGGKNRAYGVQRGMPGRTGFMRYDDGGQYNVGDEYDLTDEEIAELEAQGYVVEDVQDNMDDFA